MKLNVHKVTLPLEKKNIQHKLKFPIHKNHETFSLYNFSTTASCNCFEREDFSAYLKQIYVYLKYKMKNMYMLLSFLSS